MEDITGRLSRFLEQLRYDQLPEMVVEQVKRSVVDWYAACLAGYRVNASFNEKVLELMMGMGGTPEASVLLSGRKLPASNAAFLNAAYAHGADMDDGDRKAAGHIAASVMPSVFALAQTVGANWGQVVTAIVAGYEVFCRVVGAAQPGVYDKGFHSTGVGGGIASAAACAKLLGLDAKGIYHAISLAAIAAGGLIIIDESGQCCKPLNPANAARTGVVSAQLAQLGVESSLDPLESKKGWFNAFGRDVDLQVLFDGLGERYCICDTYLKLYPACRHTHCCIDAVLCLRQTLLDEGISIRDIDEIRVDIYPSAIRSAGSIRLPKNADEAKFSIHYCIAAAMARGRFGLEELDVERCEGYRELVSKITLVPDTSMEDRSKGIRGCHVQLGLSDGTVYRRTVLIPRGEARLPLGWTELTQKLEQCAGTLCGTQVLERNVAQIRSLRADDPLPLLWS